MKQQEAINMVLRLASAQARWGPEMSTPGMAIALVETGRTKAADGSTDIAYHITGAGFSPGESLTLVRWPLNAGAENVMSGIRLDANGTAVCGAAAAAPAAPNAPGADTSAGAASAPKTPACTTKMQANQPVEVHATVAAGEAVRVALVGETEKNGAAVTKVPFPIENENGGCKLQVILGVQDAAMVLIEGTGFPPGAPLKLDSTTAGQTRTLHPKSNPDGRMVAADLSAIKGQDNGQTTVTFAGVTHNPSLETDKNPPAPDPTCKPSVTFAWGTGSYKVQ
jgi:hypothetical protein